MAAIIKRVTSLSIVPAANIDGINISAKPTIIVCDAAAASGTCNNSKNGTNGIPKY